MSDRVDKDLALLRTHTCGKWVRDCSNRIFVYMEPDAEYLQIGEMFCDADSKMVEWAANRGVAYAELAQELECVVLPQLEMALERATDGCREHVLGAKYYIEQLLQRLEQ